MFKTYHYNKEDWSADKVVNHILELHESNPTLDRWELAELMTQGNHDFLQYVEKTLKNFENTLDRKQIK